MDDKLLFLRQGDWQWNAAICGFINIIGEENVTFDASGDICVRREILDGFAEKYFHYFIDTYFATLTLNRILQYKTTIDRHEDSNFEDFVFKDYKDLLSLRDKIKERFTKGSYVRALRRMDAGPILDTLKEEFPVLKKLKTDAAFTAAKSKLLPSIQESFHLLRQIIELCDSNEARREMGVRDAIYTVINKGWGGISIIGTDLPDDVYAGYHNDFVAPAMDDLHSNHSKYQYRCFCCGMPIKNMDKSLSFLTATGFDTGKKTSHVWNHSNDVAVCPLCYLVYSCLPAGISYAFHKGIYINVHGIERACRVSTRLLYDILNDKQKQPSVYRAVMQALQKQVSSGYQYDMADVQVVRYENEKYRFNVLSRRILDVITQSEKALENLMSVYFTQDKNRYQVYDEVADRIFESRNLFSLLHRMLYSSLNPDNPHNFGSKNVLQLLQINQRLLNKLGGVPEVSDEMVHNAHKAGYFLRCDYRDKGAKDKIPGICYRLLNALKISNSNMFLDVVLNCYLYVGKQVPKVFTDVIGKDAEFSTVGYAFVSGLIMNKGTDGKADDDSEAKTENEEELA